MYKNTHARRGVQRACNTRVVATSPFPYPGASRGPSVPSCIWRKTYAAVLCRIRNAAARSRPHRRQRQRPFRSSMCRFSGVSGCPFVHASGISISVRSVALSSSRVSLKHTTPLEWLQSGPPLPHFYVADFLAGALEFSEAARSRRDEPRLRDRPLRAESSVPRPSTPAGFHARPPRRPCAAAAPLRRPRAPTVA